ncbi:hypothetical protein [Rickettsia endosymbiont of Oedothorax gibbosus]|uniref:hypothetical protein n=1 Tax=Rickettsia endosymbiont of Oedothorax gibbosus TaxID=931099 RepID=UPI00202447C5|nr:hypothetical protein [Rickettsia endosymbiont of Oedothorax gibbosus]
MLEKFSKFREEEIRKEKARDSITETNIQEFIGVLAKKLIEYVKDKAELQECLAEFGSGWVDISNPLKITREQQKILAEINKVFREVIQEFLPLYIKEMPGFEEYKIIITELAENNDMRKFAKDYYDYEPPNKIRILETVEIHPQQLDKDDQDGVDIIGDTEGQQL